MSKNICIPHMSMYKIKPNFCIMKMAPFSFYIYVQLVYMLGVPARTGKGLEDYLMLHG